MSMRDTTISLPQAAQALGQSWERTWRQVLTGQLAGEKRDGRWLVSVASVERLARLRQRETERVQ
jgi:hypothetical protein